MLGLDIGIQIFGAASMGALRAAELHPFGMIGVGQVFQDFLNKQLNDDDEVAVLHHDQHRNYTPINDAMVNIRATLERAYQEEIISLETKELFIADCKRLFYPYSSFNKSILAFEKTHPQESEALSAWVLTHGLVDIKKQDAQLVLTQVQASISSGPTLNSVMLGNFSPISDVPRLAEGERTMMMPVTKFIDSLVDDALIESFDFQASWLPDREKKLQALFQGKDGDFQPVKLLASLIKILCSIPNPTTSSLDIDMLLEYIGTHHLYSPEQDFSGVSQDLKFSRLYGLICQLICQGNIKNTVVTDYVPVAAFYFQIEANQQPLNYHRLLRIIIVFICAAHTQLNDKRLKIKSKVLADHLRDLRLWPRLKHYNTANPTCMINQYTLMQFIAIYLQVVYVYQGTRDIIHGSPDTPQYFDWLHDAFDFYQLLKDVSIA